MGRGLVRCQLWDGARSHMAGWSRVGVRCTLWHSGLTEGPEDCDAWAWGLLEQAHRVAHKGCAVYWESSHSCVLYEKRR